MRNSPSAVGARVRVAPWSLFRPQSLLSATYLEHVKQRGLSGIIEAQEQQLGVFVEQTQRGQNVVD